MARRRYEQYCALARALDVIGERWTLLVIRELLLGPRRYTDLMDSLPGAGTNLLADRLKELERGGVISRRRLPPPAASTVYELTPAGRELEPVVLSLTRWGSARLGRPKRGEHFSPRWLALVLRASFRPQQADGLHEAYEFRIGDEVVHARVDDGAIDVCAGWAREPDLVFTTDAGTLQTVQSGALTLAGAVATGRARIDGDPRALARCEKAFGIA